MFNFETTPITRSLTLQAQWRCSAPTLTYDGNWARITLASGETYEVESEEQLFTLATGNNDTIVIIGDKTITQLEITGIELGTKVTTLPHNAFAREFTNPGKWGNLMSFNGFHEGLVSIGQYCLSNSTPGAKFQHPTLNATIVFPFTVTSVGTGFLGYTGTLDASLYIDCPATVFENLAGGWVYSFTSYYSTDEAFTKGIAVGGGYATDFIARFPNTNQPSAYRNLYLLDGNEEGA